MDIKKSYHCSPDCLREHWAFHRDFHTQSRENGGWWCGLHMQPQRAPTPIGLVSKCSAWTTAAARPPNHGRHFARHALILLFIDRAGVLPRAGLLQGLLHLQQQRSTHSFLPLLLPSLQARASPSPASTPSRAPTPTATAARRGWRWGGSASTRPHPTMWAPSSSLSARPTMRVGLLLACSVQSLCCEVGATVHPRTLRCGWVARGLWFLVGLWVWRAQASARHHRSTC